MNSCYPWHDCNEHFRYGDDDELGFLNRLTDDLVKEAAKEIQSGTR
jgi:hypothetical protein